MIKKFWKTFLVDLLLLIILFWLFVFSKNYVAGFMNEINTLNFDVEEIEAELANNSTDIVEGFVEEYQYSILWYYFYLLYIIPLIAYLLFFGSQALNIGLLKNDLKKFFWQLLFGVPVLIFFYLFGNYFLNNFVDVMNSIWVSIVLFLFLGLMFGGSYVWFGYVCGDYKKFLKKFYLFLPLFILFVLLFGVGIMITLYLAALYLVSALMMTELFKYFILVCLVLVGIQYLRKFILRKVCS